MAKTDREPFTVVVATDAERPLAGHWVRVGYGALVLFTGAFLVWSGLAPIESAAVAAGSVSLDTNKKLIQHLEGGIVAEILIREGHVVERNQVLLRLDVTQARSRIDQLKSRIASSTRQLALNQEELDTVERLLQRGQATKPRLLGLQRRKAEIEGQIEEFQSQLKVAEDIIARAEVRAPIAGTIIDMKIHTAGGVIKAGETLMSIVPKDEPLIIEARIDPNDIDVVRPGLPANVRLTPYSARMAQPLPGKVSHVSADRFTDPATNATYYQVRVTLEQKPSEISGLKLYPGMPAEVIIITGERTVLAYLVAPITRSFRRAFREE